MALRDREHVAAAELALKSNATSQASSRSGTKRVAWCCAAQVKTLANYIRTIHGRIDVLVNDIWGGELLKGGPADWNTPVWKHLSRITCVPNVPIVSARLIL